VFTYKDGGSSTFYKHSTFCIVAIERKKNTSRQFLFMNNPSIQFIGITFNLHIDFGRRGFWRL